MTKFSKALRLLQESQLIAQLIRSNFGKNLSTGSKQYDEIMEKLHKENADFESFIFVSILYIIFAKKGFGEWTDFWYDMGERIFSNDAYDPEDDRADADDETPTCDDDE